MIDYIDQLHERVTNLLQHTPAAPLMPFPLTSPNVVKLDLSLANSRVASVDITNIQALTALIQGEISRAGGKIGIGGYNEHRGWYARATQFSEGTDIRCIHLGIDIWTDPEVAICSPYDAKVHSFQDNALIGDYGPTIILEHSLSGVIFYTLYGHLSKRSLLNKQVGMHISQGEQFATIGSPPTNGDWPAHLHFQIILDMLGKHGDYPGVASLAQREKYLLLCPNPELILNASKAQTHS